MWRPDDVVTEHKKRATALWAALLLTIVGFIVWQTVALVDKYNDPSTSFTVSDDLYQFPYTEVCLGENFGCDWGAPNCIESVTATIEDPCYNVWDVQIESAPTSPACVTFDMEQVEMEAWFSDECLGGAERPYVKILMNWISDNETSIEYSSSVSVFLGGEDVHQQIWVPYTRFVSPEDQLTPEVWVPQTDLAIGKSVRSFLSGDDIIAYPLVTSSTVYLITRDPSDWYYYISHKVLGSSTSSSSSSGGNVTFGELYFTITQDSFSLTELSEDNPIDMFDFIGNIGGFWEILLLAWGIFFIAKHSDSTPKQEARNFSQSIQRRIQMRNRPVGARGASRSAVTFVEEFELEEYPNVVTAYAGPRRAESSSVGGPRQASSGIVDGPRQASSSSHNHGPHQASNKSIDSPRRESSSSIHGPRQACSSSIDISRGERSSSIHGPRQASGSSVHDPRQPSSTFVNGETSADKSTV